jgi:predicted amidophosphoribosyltransferase
MNSSNAIHWRLRQPRYRLVGSLCERCGQPVFPVRPLCPDCAAWFGDDATANKWDEVTVVFLPLKLPSYASQ